MSLFTRNHLYAGLWRRAVAFLLDQLVITSGILVVAGMARIPVFSGYMHPDDMVALVMISVTSEWLYYAFLESSQLRATLGKHALGLRVIDTKGGVVSFAQATGRYFAKILSFLPFGIGFVMIGVTKKKQGLHDMMSGCFVVREKKK